MSSLPVLERFRKIIKQKCGSQKKFCELTGINEKTLSSIFRRKSGPNYETLMAVISAFSDINVEWLMKGEGDMERKILDESIKITDSNEYLVKRFEEVINELRDIKDEVKKKDELIIKQNEEIEKLKRKQIYKIEKKDDDVSCVAEATPELEKNN